jgi:L-alanine-DL-glutamate epimerase-like enolase superfamily enzyme
MVIDRVKAYKISLPLSGAFSHSRSTKTSADNIVVEVIAENGKITGYGEGAPRPGVTGESQESAMDSLGLFIRQGSFPWELNDVSQVWDFVDGLPEGKEHNSAVCALEMALLDVLGKLQGRSIIQYFPQDFFSSRVCYGAMITLEGKEKVLNMCNLIKGVGINHIKMKLGKDFQQNKNSLEAIKLVFGEDYVLRIDANNAWDFDSARKLLPLLKEYNIRFVEQPLTPDEPDMPDFAQLMKNSGVTLVADELACSLSDVETIAKEDIYKMVNVRLSKCGGFRKSLGIIDYLRKNGILFQIGCHLGESGLLSAAGRVLCLLCRDSLFYDGCYDSFLLKENITLEHVSFGPGGEAGPLDGPGLGVEIKREALTRLSSDVAIFEPFA